MNLVFLILAIIFFILGGVVAIDDPAGEILGLNALAFISFGLGWFAASFLPWADWRTRVG